MLFPRFNSIHHERKLQGSKHTRVRDKYVVHPRAPIGPEIVHKMNQSGDKDNLLGEASTGILTAGQA